MLFCEKGMGEAGCKKKVTLSAGCDTINKKLQPGCSLMNGGGPASHMFDAGVIK